MKTLVALTEADISQNLTISIFLGTVETNFIQIMCAKRDRSTPEVSPRVFSLKLELLSAEK
jgi:hypothetical protein